jgi:hypothetical protein
MKNAQNVADKATKKRIIEQARIWKPYIQKMLNKYCNRCGEELQEFEQEDDFHLIKMRNGRVKRVCDICIGHLCECGNEMIDQSDLAKEVGLCDECIDENKNMIRDFQEQERQFYS